MMDEQFRASGRINTEASDPAKRAKNPEVMAERFKNTFSRKDVKVHFLGAWYVPVFLVLSTNLSQL